MKKNNKGNLILSLVNIGLVLLVSSLGRIFLISEALIVLIIIGISCSIDDIKKGNKIDIVSLILNIIAIIIYALRLIAVLLSWWN